MLRIRPLIIAPLLLGVGEYTSTVSIKDPTLVISPRNQKASEQRQPLPGRNACPIIPPAYYSVNGNSFYIDSRNSVIDPLLFERAAKEESKIRAFTSELGHLSNILMSTSKDSGAEHCTTHWLETWAQAKAMEGETEDNGSNYRVWALVPIAQSFNILENRGSLGDSSKKLIAAWIGRIAALNEAYINRNNVKNNISYWASAGFALSAVSTQNRDLLALAIKLASAGVDSVSEDGFLPGELRRGERALEYHGFALDPLSIAAEVAYVNGYDLFHRNRDALLRVGHNLLSSEWNSALFDEASGIRQNFNRPLAIGNFGWTEILARHYSDGDVRAFLDKHRPIYYDRMGGDVTRIYKLE